MVGNNILNIAKQLGIYRFNYMGISNKSKVSLDKKSKNFIPNKDRKLKPLNKIMAYLILLGKEV